MITYQLSEEHTLISLLTGEAEDVTCLVMPLLWWWGLEFLLRVRLGSSPSITSTPTIYDSSFCPVTDHAEGILRIIEKMAFWLTVQLGSQRSDGQSLDVSMVASDG